MSELPEVLLGVRVLDLSIYPPGAFATMLLADFGADVTVVEPPLRLSTARRPSLVATDGPPGWDDDERLLAYNPLRRNKRSIVVDLKSADGVAVVRRLAATADVVVEGFRPGVADRLGLGYDQLREVNPALVYCSVTGYGQDGPRRQEAGHDLNYIATSGLLSLVGSRAGDLAIPVNIAGDFAGGGLMAAYGVLLALWASRANGHGQHVDVAMTDGNLALLASQVGRTLAGERAPEAGRGRLTGRNPNYNVYRCKDGGWIAVGCVEPEFWLAFCIQMGRPEWVAAVGDPDAAERCYEELVETFQARSRDDWMTVLDGAAYCVSPVLSIDEALEDEHARARDRVLDVLDPRVGPVRQIGVTPRLGSTPGRVRTPSAKRGEHTADVLAELGFAAAEIAALRQAGAVE